jgi:hypothetical protein
MQTASSDPTLGICQDGSYTSNKVTRGKSMEERMKEQFDSILKRVDQLEQVVAHLPEHLKKPLSLVSSVGNEHSLNCKFNRDREWRRP